MPGSCVTVDMGFGSVDTAYIHTSLGMYLDLLLPPCWEQKCVGFHGYFLLSPLLSSRWGLLGLRLLLKRLASISLIPVSHLYNHNCYVVI